jgi:hypothetical protein
MKVAPRGPVPVREKDQPKVGRPAVLFLPRIESPLRPSSITTAERGCADSIDNARPACAASTVSLLRRADAGSDHKYQRSP